MTRLAGVVLAALLTAASAACGSSTPAPGRSSAGAGGRTTARASGSAGRSPAVTAGPVGGDSTVAIAPSTYERPSDPCVGIETTASMVTAVHACAVEWAGYAEAVVPGLDLMKSALPLPHTVAIAAGLNRADAIALATAAYRWFAFQYWASTYNALDMMKRLDPLGHLDPIASALAGGARVIQQRPCTLPAAFRVAPLSDAALGFLQGSGWPAARGTMAVVATFPRCDGTTLGKAAAQFTVDATPAPISAVIAGTLSELPPFGRVIFVTGEAACGDDPALRSMCGL